MTYRSFLIFLGIYPYLYKMVGYNAIKLIFSDAVSKILCELHLSMRKKRNKNVFFWEQVS